MNDNLCHLLCIINKCDEIFLQKQLHPEHKADVLLLFVRLQTAFKYSIGFPSMHVSCCGNDSEHFNLLFRICHFNCEISQNFNQVFMQKWFAFLHQRCLKTRETHKLCQQLQAVRQLLWCAQVEMRGLFYLNYIYIQFLSSKMRSAFDLIGLLNIFRRSRRWIPFYY